MTAGGSGNMLEASKKWSRMWNALVSYLYGLLSTTSELITAILSRAAFPGAAFPAAAKALSNSCTCCLNLCTSCCSCSAITRCCLVEKFKYSVVCWGMRNENAKSECCVFVVNKVLGLLIRIGITQNDILSPHRRAHSFSPQNRGKHIHSISTTVARIWILSWCFYFVDSCTGRKCLALYTSLCWWELEVSGRAAWQSNSFHKGSLKTMTHIIHNPQYNTLTHIEVNFFDIAIQRLKVLNFLLWYGCASFLILCIWR